MFMNLVKNSKLIEFSKLIDHKTQELIILPTEKCNFRCTYCYEDFSIGKMKLETRESIKKFIKKRAPLLDKLNISWFGGEPLLAKDIVLDISSYAHKCSQEYDELEFNAGMTTNGY